MITRSSKLAAFAVPVFFLFAASQSTGQEKLGTKQDVEKRLKAVEKSESAKPLDAVVKTLFAAHRFEQVAISPDASKVAWVETLVDKDGTPSGTVIRLKDLKNAASAPRRVSAAASSAPHAEGNVSWSPDSKQIAFLSD